MSKNIIRFSRHQPTTDQLAECERRGWNVAGLDEGVRLGAMNLLDDGDVHAVTTALLTLADEHNAAAIIGVWAAPMLEKLSQWTSESLYKDIPCYAAWNISRPAEGGKPVFEHRRLCFVGRLSYSLR